MYVHIVHKDLPHSAQTLNLRVCAVPWHSVRARVPCRAVPSHRVAARRFPLGSLTYACTRVYGALAFGANEKATHARPAKMKLRFILNLSTFSPPPPTPPRSPWLTPVPACVRCPGIRCGCRAAPTFPSGSLTYACTRVYGSLAFGAFGFWPRGVHRGAEVKNME